MYRFGSDNRDVDREGIIRDIERLEKLLADLWVVGRSPFPFRRVYNDKTLGNAPLLEEWQPAVRMTPCLVGLATGHPTLPGSRRRIVTSDLWLISEELGFARSLSRWYRLGTPAYKSHKDSDDEE
jgi:hypothetical protein